MKNIYRIGILALILAAAQVYLSRQAMALPNNFQKTIVINSGLNLPTDFQFAPDGRIFITEQNGTVLVYKNGQLLSTPAITIPVVTGGDRGLLSVALDPNFNANQYIYFLYTDTNNHQTISRFKASGDIIDPNTKTILLQNSETWSGFLNAGAIRFGQDGKLYGSFGSNGEGSIAQDLSSLDGKIVRINSDGSIPADNPFMNFPGAQKSIYAYGFRNPWRLNFDTNGTAIVGDVGVNTWEKIVRIQSGGNYGWPMFEGDCTPNCNGVIPPLFVENHNGGGMAVIGGDVNKGTNTFPAQYNGNYFYGDYVLGYINNVAFDANHNVSSNNNFDNNDGSLANIGFGPDGCLYYLDIFPGKLSKICYGQAAAAPTAIAGSDINSGQLPLTVNFSSVGTSDPSNGALTYNWNFGDGSSSTQANPSHIYNQKGIYTATLTASNTGGASASASVKIWAGYTAPNITITAPVTGSKYNAGQSIAYSATATTSSGSALPASDFQWKFIPHNGQNYDAPTVVNGVTSGNFVIPTTADDEPDDTSSYEFHVIVTDSTGLSSEKVVIIYPNISTLTIVSNPNGLNVSQDQQVQASPITLPAVVGFTYTLGTNSPQTLNGNPYTFNSWSDGGTMSHNITAPAVDTTYTANFALAGSGGNTTGGSGGNAGTASFNDKINLNNTNYAPNANVALTTSITANQNISNLNLDTELWNNGNKILQQVTPVNLTANSATSCVWNFYAPAAGTYTVKVGVFAADWSKLYFWDDIAAATAVSGTPVAKGTLPNNSCSNTTAPPPPSQINFTSSASTDSATYNPNAPMNISTTLKADQNAQNMLVDTEIWNSAGKIAQNLTNANLVANTSMTNTWQTMAPANPGTYTIKIGVFAADWSKLYYWNDNAASITVSSASNNPPPGSIAFGVSATMPQTQFNPGQTSTITTNVAATQSLSNVLVDTEIWSSAGNKVAQNLVPANLIANQQFTTNWDTVLPSTNGPYTIKVGVFAADWSSVYFWSNNTMQFNIGAASPPPNPGQTYPITILQPANNSTVSGSVEIRAVINGLDINKYNIGWRTGNGAYFNLDTDPVTQSYKHAWIDFSLWNWSPTNTYEIDFQATDQSGNVIGNNSITVVHY